MPGDVLDRIAHDIHVRLLAEAEIRKRIASARSGIQEVYANGATAPQINRGLRYRLEALGHSPEELKGAGIGVQTIYKVVESR